MLVLVCWVVLIVAGATPVTTAAASTAASAFVVAVSGGAITDAMYVAQSGFRQGAVWIANGRRSGVAWALTLECLMGWVCGGERSRRTGTAPTRSRWPVAIVVRLPFRVSNDPEE